jgi:riboflavin kinase/FMN adenylyltransferase
VRSIETGNSVPPEFRGSLVTIGNFDGVHRGHQELLLTANREAERLGKPWGLVTFEPHPRSFFRPDEPVFRLTPLPLKARLAAALGASFVMVIVFDKELSLLEPAEFVARHLVERLAAAHVVTGYDFHFGRGRRGSPATMRELGRRHGFGVTVVDQVADEGDTHSPFSSSSIRSALRHGHVEAAARELGYHWTVMGEVVKGDSRGRAIGFPTINIVLDAGAEPFRGIYAARVRDAGVRGGTAWRGAGYFGSRPTFDSERTYLEVYLMDFGGDLYGRTMLVELTHLIRPDRRFESIAELAQQMHEDCAAARARLETLDRDNPLTAYRLGRLQQDGML